MEHHSPPISHEAKTTIADVVRWAHELVRLHARIKTVRWASFSPTLPLVGAPSLTANSICSRSGLRIKSADTKLASPPTVRFQTKPDLARCMLQRVWDAQIPIAWVVGDSAYGENLDLRTWLQEHGYAYVLEVHCDESIGIVAPDGRRRLVHVADIPALLLSEQSWQRLSMSEGTKGPRLFDWACVPILHHWQQDGQHWLLLRRSVTNAHDLSYYLVFGPPATTLQQMAHASGGRWHIEEDFENMKDMGLDHYEVRSWIDWYCHVTLVMLAHTFLTGVCAQSAEHALANSATHNQTSEEHEPSAVLSPVLALTVPEVRHLLGHLIWPVVTSVTLVLAWSLGRRCHRSWASYYHRQRRLQALAHTRSPCASQDSR